jgi:hypothetical protein
MTEFKYSEAARCGACDERTSVPTREAADRFVMKSEGLLKVVDCPIGNGYHLTYPAVELTRR